MRTSGLVKTLMAAPAMAIVSPDGTGKLPALGWNSWNEYGCDISETVFLEVAQLMIDLGLKDAGYEYVNIDDCWSDKELRRDSTTNRIIVDTVKFPQGISHLADQVHEMGLKLGIYSDAGETCPFSFLAVRNSPWIQLMPNLLRNVDLRRICGLPGVRGD
jgi:alpha-galactosidase